MWEFQLVGTPMLLTTSFCDMETSTSKIHFESDSVTAANSYLPRAFGSFAVAACRNLLNTG
jgi:hypothetical protein